MAQVETRNINVIDEVAARIKEAPIGAFIKEEELYSIVERAIDKAFFEERKETVNYRTETKDAFVVEMAKAQFKSKIDEYIMKYIESKDAEFKEALNTQMTQVLAELTGEAMLRAFIGRVVNTPLMNFEQSMREQLSKILGQPVLYR